MDMPEEADSPLPENTMMFFAFAAAATRAARSSSFLNNDVEITDKRVLVRQKQETLAACTR